MLGHSSTGPQIHLFLHSLGVHGEWEPLSIPQCNPQSSIEFSLPEKTLEQRSKQVLLPDIGDHPYLELSTALMVVLGQAEHCKAYQYQLTYLLKETLPSHFPSLLNF